MFRFGILANHRSVKRDRRHYAAKVSAEIGILDASRQDLSGHQHVRFLLEILVVVHVHLVDRAECSEPRRLAPAAELPLDGAIHRLAIGCKGELVRPIFAPVDLHRGSVRLAV